MGGHGESTAGAAAAQRFSADGVRFVVLSAVGAAAIRAGIPPATVEVVWRELGAT